MNYDYEGLLCKKCMHVGLLNTAIDNCEVCGSKLNKVTIDLQELLKENKIDIASLENDGDEIFNPDIDNEFDLDDD